MKRIDRSAFSVHRSSLVFKTPWGWMGLSASARGLRRVILPQPSRTGVVSALGTTSLLQDRHCPSTVRQAGREIRRFLRGEQRDFTVPLDLTGGTPFQRQVWRATRHIPYGRVRSYRWIAARVGDARSARAVGNALGANPVPLLIPCHRVVASDASLGGFTGGLQTKRRLLALEGTLRLLGAKRHVKRQK